jgi:phage terminase large subunit-like protein
MSLSNPTDVQSLGSEICQWIRETLYVPEGRWIGTPIELADWQVREIKRIYDNPAKTRRAILSFGRKNGKTALAAMLTLAHLAGPVSIHNSQLYSTGMSREQAALIFRLAAKMTRMSPILRDLIAVHDGRKSLECPERGTIYQALSAEASTAFGLSPAFTVHDELGQVRGPRSELYEALETATGAQLNPLSLIISTQAPTDADLLSILIDDAMAGNDPRVICSLYTAPMEDDPFAVETIKKANPAFGNFLNPDEVKAMADDARRMPAREPQYRNLILNQRVEASSPFVKPAQWKACGAPPKDLRGRDCYGGLDLSESQDLTALVLIGADENLDWSIEPTFWLPGEGLADKARADRVPYDTWAEQGFLQTTPGRSIGFDFVARYLVETFKTHRVRKIGFDRWGMVHLKPWLIQAGMSEQAFTDMFVPFGQGTRSMSPALRELEGLILDRKLRHGNHPVLTMCAANAVTEDTKKAHTKDSSNRKLSKKRSAGRIDGMVALAMACGVAPLGVRNFDPLALIG